VKIRAVRGMNDILPAEARSWHRVEACFRRIAELFGYGEIRTPLIEDTALFAKQIGETSDVVEKEMYSFRRHDDELTVRPEGTAGAARAYVEHALWGREPVTRWYYVGAMFRGERPAKGRYRQFHQAGCELYGDPGPLADAEMIDLCVRVLRQLEIGDVTVHLNSLGSVGESPEAGTRARYRQALLDFFVPKRAELSEDSQRRLEKNPLRILDSKDPRDQSLAAGAPEILEVLSAEDREHFEGVKTHLGSLGIPFVIDPRLVRGLDYYSRTLFEIKANGADLGAQNTVCGGGRYDGMIESLGGPKTPAIGFAMGLERLLIAHTAALTSATAPDAGDTWRPAVYVGALRSESDPGRAVAVGLDLARQLRDRAIRCDVDGRDSKLKGMLRRADANRCRFFVILGEDELASDSAMVKDLAHKSQEKMGLGQVAGWIAERLQGDV
jgi:histidyl-tRNA synthetase